MLTKLPTLLRRDDAFRVIGAPTPRVVGLAKVTGAARYTAERRAPDMLYAFPVTTSLAAGRIREIDVSRATAAPGVVRVFTHENLDEIGAVSLHGLTGRGGSAFAPMEGPEIRYAGQMIAVVVAETVEAGEHARGLVEAEYEATAANTSLDGAEAREVIAESRGDLAAGHAEGDATVEVTLHQPMHFHNPIEPPATLAVWDGPQVTVYEPSQGITSLQTFLGRALKVPVENVRVVSEYIGGGFGVKGTSWYHTPITAMIAREVGRPVMMLPSREDMYGIWGHRPMSRQSIKVSARRDGRLTAYEVESHASTSLSDDSPYPAMVEGHLMINSCRNARASLSLVRLNTNTPIYMRSPGEAESHYAHSIAMDVLADELGMDPLEVFEINHADTNLASGNPWSAKYLREAWTAAAEKFGWSQRPRTPRSRLEGDEYVGYGMSIGAYPGYQSLAMAKVRLYNDHTVKVLCGSQSLGQGNYTIMAQSAAEVLGVDVGSVSVDLGDTDLPKAQISGGSRTSSGVTAAIMAAASELRESALTLASADATSPLYGVSPEALTMEGFEVYVTDEPARRATVAELLGAVSQQYIEGWGEWGGKEISSRLRGQLMVGKDFILGPTIDGRDSFAYIATFAEVRVHRRTGMYRISRIVSGYDCGRVLNPKLAESQCKGGITFAIGHACSEETAIDPNEHRIVNSNLADYHIPVQADVPDIEIVFVNEPDDHVHPLGIKGVGEVAGTGAAAAILNAMHNATGVRVTELPAYPEQFVTAEA